jgi:hypothetical protein
VFASFHSVKKVEMKTRPRRRRKTRCTNGLPFFFPLFIAGASVVLAGCGLGNYIPRGPSLSPEKQASWLEGETRPVTYTSGPRVCIPILPFQVFALRYEEDIVVETDHPHWSMHEFARVRIGKREEWLAKDSNEEGLQTVTADLSDIVQWFPEVPVPRHVSPVEVEEHSTGEMLDIRLAYRNPLGERTVLQFRSPRPPERASRRNGSTFNHSGQAVAAVLDIPARQLKGTRARVSYNGRPARIRRVLGLVPVKALLEQTQAGFCAASMRLTLVPAGDLIVDRPVPGTEWPTRANETWAWKGDQLHYRNRTSAWDYGFKEGGVSSAAVYQAGRPLPLLRVLLSAPLPDLSRPFAGEVVRRFVLEINGQAHGYGDMTARSTADGAVLDIRPAAPSWFAARPMRSRIWFVDPRTVDVMTQRVP